MTRDEADAQLAQAIANHAEAFGITAEDELLGDYAVIAHWQRVEQDGRCRYSTQYSHDNMPRHIAVGLFTTGASFAAEDDE